MRHLERRANVLARCGAYLPMPFGYCVRRRCGLFWVTEPHLLFYMHRCLIGAASFQRECPRTDAVLQVQVQYSGPSCRFISSYQ